MRVSIVIPVLNSHDVLHRQCLHFEKMGLDSDTEIIIVDDGSDPPLEYSGPLQLTMLHTNDTRPWTWALARNRGAKEAKGDWLILYDLDHIIRKDLIDMVKAYDGHIVQFKREFGVLLPDGTFTQDTPILMDYGWPISRLQSKGLTMPAHPNMFAMKRDVFWEIGGYREDRVHKPYPQGEDRLFKKSRYRWVQAGKGKVHPDRPIIYMFPNGKLIGDVDCDPKGLFHKLSRATSANHIYKRQVQLHGKDRTFVKG